MHEVHDVHSVRLLAHPTRVFSVGRAYGSFAADGSLPPNHARVAALAVPRAADLNSVTTQTCETREQRSAFADGEAAIRIDPEAATDGEQNRKKQVAKRKRMPADPNQHQLEEDRGHQEPDHRYKHFVEFLPG